MKNQSCSICNGPIDDHVDENGVVYWTGGHNAEPINDGRCCTKCNDTVVLHARIMGIDKSHIKTRTLENSKGEQLDVKIVD